MKAKMRSAPEVDAYTLPTGRGRKALFVAALVLSAALFLFADLSSFPLVLWDESRLAVNAIEMSLKGFGFSTTYEFVPDFWNTKPPLQIWFMTLSLRVFSDAEFALRFPSALSALLTVLVTAFFSYQITKSLFAGILAGLLLTTSKLFYGTHVARTGDYDAQLVFFTSCYILLIFSLIHRVRVSSFLISLVGVCVAGAVLTKGVAGLMPGIGIPIYLLIVGRFKHVLFVPKLIIGVGIAIFPVAAFYFYREVATPGFLAAVWQNEFGRYVVDLDSQTSVSSPLAYAKNITMGFGFSLGPLVLLLLPIGWLLARPKLRTAISYFLVLSIAFVASISFGSTRYSWYDAPVYPMLAIASAISIRAILAIIRDSRPNLPLLPSSVTLGRAVAPLLIFGMLLLCVKAIYHRHFKLIKYQEAYESGYGPLLKKLASNGIRNVAIVDPGRGDGAGAAVDGHYNPILRFYALLYESRDGLRIFTLHKLQTADKNFDGIAIATCNPAVLRDMSKGQPIPVDGCAFSGAANKLPGSL
jgi:4-amino-4-deoxy-L-arabinose transferase-like glycosyltransferase